MAGHRTPEGIRLDEKAVRTSLVQAVQQCIRVLNHSIPAKPTKLVVDRMDLSIFMFTFFRGQTLGGLLCNCSLCLCSAHRGRHHRHTSNLIDVFPFPNNQVNSIKIQALLERLVPHELRPSLGAAPPSPPALETQTYLGKIVAMVDGCSIKPLLARRLISSAKHAQKAQTHAFHALVLVLDCQTRKV